ncbi:TerD family protein [Streptomyces sp. CAU 1734]|uniref:TerD family protein n=1 Tax=Streptomyces sp. CAU 1734 TaxID=3140360 RepID=UPI00326171D8
MGQMVKGGNCSVPSVPLRVVVRHDSGAGAPALEVMTLLLDAVSGRMRGPHDLVTSGQPAHPSGAVRHGGGGGGAHWIEFDPAAAEHLVGTVVLAGTTLGGVLAGLTDPVVEVFAPDGASVARYEVTGAGEETAFVFGEFYRRAGGWKFRAVGQGYASGTAGLTADYGIPAGSPPASGPPVPPPFAPPAAPAGPPPFAPPPSPAGGPPGGPPPPPAFRIPPPAGALGPPPGPVTGVPPMAPPHPAVAPGPPAVWSFGPVFRPFVSRGRGTGVADTGGAVPPGPVLVEAEFRGDSFNSVSPLGRDNKAEDSLIFGMDDYRGSAPLQAPRERSLRLKVETGESWTVTVKPLAAARRLEGTLHGAGAECFLHLGGPMDLTVDYRGSENLIVHYYEVAGVSELPEDSENLVNEIGARRVTLPLPPGPLLVWFEYAEGPWTIGCRPVG